MIMMTALIRCTRQCAASCVALCITAVGLIGMLLKELHRVVQCSALDLHEWEGVDGQPLGREVRPTIAHQLDEAREEQMVATRRVMQPVAQHGGPVARLGVHVEERHAELLRDARRGVGVEARVAVVAGVDGRREVVTLLGDEA